VTEDDPGPDLDLRELGQRVRSWRERAGRAQKDVAADARVSASLLSHLEAGRKAVSVTALERVMDAAAVPDGERPVLRAALHNVNPATLSGPGPPRSGTPRPRVADLAVGAVRWLDPFDVAIAEHGGAALDPRAEVYDQPGAQPMIRIRREVDGRLLLDRSASAPAPLAVFEAPRHIVRPESVYRFPDDPEPWRQYARTRITITPASGRRRLVCEHREAGPEGAFPTWDEVGGRRTARRGRLEVIHALTAENPHWQRSSGEANESAHRLLGLALRDGRALVLDAVLESQDEDVDFTEIGYAVCGADRDTITDIARQFGQSSFFEWTADERRVIPVDAPTEGWTHLWRRNGG